MKNWQLVLLFGGLNYTRQCAELAVDRGCKIELLVLSELFVQLWNLCRVLLIFLEENCPTNYLLFVSGFRAEYNCVSRQPFVDGLITEVRTYSEFR